MSYQTGALKEQARTEEHTYNYRIPDRAHITQSSVAALSSTMVTFVPFLHLPRTLEVESEFRVAMHDSLLPEEAYILPIATSTTKYG